MLLEDEGGVVNVIVPPPVYERCRLAVRTAAFALIEGRLERREGVINLLAVDGRAAQRADRRRRRGAPHRAAADREPAASSAKAPAPAGELAAGSRPALTASARRGLMQDPLQNICSVRGRS